MHLVSLFTSGIINSISGLHNEKKEIHNHNRLSVSLIIQLTPTKSVHGMVFNDSIEQ